MAIRPAVPGVAESIETAGSDYGSDLDDETWDTVFSQADSQPLNEIAITDIIETPIGEDGPEIQVRSLRVARIRAHFQAGYEELNGFLADLEEPKSAPAVQILDIEDTWNSAIKASRQVKLESTEDGQQSLKVENVPRERSASVQPDGADTRSPLERFRTKPKKPLSVTDIISPAWCELQYWHSLTKHGRIRKTPAMKQGSKIHKEKEREVHTEVPVETISTEDKFGLRLWNIISGLRTLRMTGLTRELEVLGTVDGEVIVGVIDEISSTCPDDEAEALILLAGEDATAKNKGRQRKSRSKKAGPAFPADQPVLTDYFASSQESNGQAVPDSWLGSLRDEQRSLYLVDIKTRRSKTLPPAGSQMRPTRMQLMMYRRLLSDLAANKFEGDTVFKRYDLDSSKVFSDTFIAAMSNINIDSEELSVSADVEHPYDSVTEITSHNTLDTLWSLMISEFARTIPPSSISPMLTAEFRASDSGDLIGKRAFAFDTKELDTYVASAMQWWRGQREARGVDIEEAYKCGICEFADSCSWRADKIEQATKRARSRNAATSRAKG